MKKKIFLLLIIISSVFVSCFEDLDDNIQIASTQDIQNFIYRGLNYFYLYKADNTELNANLQGQELTDFIDSYDSPEALFEYLKSPQDRFSLLVDDYIELENTLSGITLNHGMEFGLIFYPDGSDNVFGYARYVLPNSDAAAKGVERGMIFNTIDGQQITENNFKNLLEPDTYIIGLATLDDEDVNPTGESIELAKQQYTENPIFIAETLTIDGQKIGYIMYNAFTRGFDPQLNAAFGQFKADGVSELILDLRYNGGGSVETAIDLSSMITGQFNGQLFVSEQWNADRQAEYASDKLFNNEISTGEGINSLNLNRVYILTSGRSASASELVINGLNPYINVMQVGGTTTGKFQASFLLYDAPAPNFSRSQANTGHTYAMLPLVFKTANSVGFTDFVDGLDPDIEYLEDYSNLGVLGDVNEPLLATALNDIFGLPQPQPFTSNQFEEISESKAMLPAYQLMIAEE
ncbi:MAG: S41 family peptidase [Flavobacteriaceae bacterium]|nr:S41 family peptidase [Flavobacteriaceae bacterium]